MSIPGGRCALTAGNRSIELTLLEVVFVIGAKLGPVYDFLALVHVAGVRYDRNQVATARVLFDHGFSIVVEYGAIHTVCQISTIANIDYRLA